MDIQQQLAAQVEPEYGYVDILALTDLVIEWRLSQPLGNSDAEETGAGDYAGPSGTCILPNDGADPELMPIRNLQVVTKTMVKPGLALKLNGTSRINCPHIYAICMSYRTIKPI